MAERATCCYGDAVKWIRPICMLAVSLTALTVRAGSDPDRTWFTLQTKHFAVHSYDGGGDLAKRVAAFAEEAYVTVNELLGHSPDERIHIAVVDDIDASNGYARVIPYSEITILAAPPLPGGGLSAYDDWLKLLVVHEYAHVVHLNHTSGLPRFLNRFFGKTFAPNQSLPRWLTEGIATWIESRLTQAGRLDSSRYRMLLRTQALAKPEGFLKLRELTGAPLTPPGASLWYLYGAVMVDEIVRGAGEGGLRQFIETYGRRIVPYGVNLALRRATGHSLDHWYEKMTSRYRQQALKEKGHIEKRGIREGRAVTSGGFYKSFPRFSPDGKRLLYVRTDGHERTRLMSLDWKDKRTERELITCRGGCGRFDFTRDGRNIWLSSGRHHKRVNFYRELVEIDGNEPSAMSDARVVTGGARFSQVSTQRDGTRIWGVSMGWGKTWLEARDASTGQVVFRWYPPGYERVSHPIASPEGRSVYFAMHADGNHDLYRLDLDGRRLSRLTFGASIEFDLVMTPDGQWLLYTSDADGVYNIYARHTDTGRTVRLTNVMTGAFAPEISPDGRNLVYVGWTVNGQEIYHMPFRPETATFVSVPDPRSPQPGPEPPVTTVEKSEYEPLSSLLPRSILPTLTGDSAGLGHLGLALGGQDVTERLSAGLIFVHDFHRNDFSFDGSITIRHAWPDIRIGFGRYSVDNLAFVGDREYGYREETLYAAFDLGLAFPSVILPTELDVGLTIEAYRSLDGFTPQHTPDQNSHDIPDEGLSPKIHVGWGFSSVTRSELNISPSEGVEGYVRAGLRYRRGSDRRVPDGWLTNVDYHLAGYLQLPWAHDQVWAARLEGGWRAGHADYLRMYRLGGVPPTDIISDVLNLAQHAPVWFRGFAPDAYVGSSYHLLVNEFRFPLMRGRTGLDSLPIFFKDLHGALFADAGMVWGGEASRREGLAETKPTLGLSLGGEIRLDLELLFGLNLNLRLGYAHGLGEHSRGQVYFFLAPPP